MFSLLLIASAPHVSHAQSSAPSSVEADAEGEPAGYRRLVAAALSEYEAGHFEESRALMLRAHQLFPSARTLRGLGMVSFELREYPESVRQLEQALESRARPLEGELRVQTEALLERARTFVGRLALTLQPADAHVFVDGMELAPEAAHEVLLAVGDHSLEVRGEGYIAERRTVRIDGGESELLRISLTPLASPERLGSSGHRSWYRSPWLWVSMGVVVAAGAATTSALLWKSHQDAPRQEPYRGLSGEPPLSGPAP